MIILKVAQRVSPVEQKLTTFPEHLSFFGGVGEGGVRKV